MLGLPVTDVRYIWHEISLRRDHKHCNDVTKLQFSESNFTATTVWVYGLGGLEQWNGILEWSGLDWAGMEWLEE